jgi:hypothetical protein
MAADEEAIFEAVVFLEHFADLPDPRQLIKVIYPLDEVLLLSLLAVLAGAETFTDIARFGENKLDLLRRHPQAPGHAGRRRRDHHHRLPARDRPEGHRQEGELRPRPER